MPEQNNREPTRPCDVLREYVLPTLNMRLSDIATTIGVSHRALRETINGKRKITPEFALRIGKFLRNDPYMWLMMQGNHDLWDAQQLLSDEIAKIPEYI